MESVEKDHVRDGVHETRITVSSCCCHIFQQNRKRSKGDGTTALVAPLPTPQNPT